MAMNSIQAARSLAAKLLHVGMIGTVMMNSAYAGVATLTPSPALLVVNQGDATVSIVDPISQRETASIIEGVPATIGHEVATSPNGRLAYLPLYGNAGVGKPGTDGSLMLVIDLHTRKVKNRVDFGHGVRPHCVIYDRVSHLLYVTTELDQTVTIVDPRSLQVVGTIPTHQDESHMLAISHDGKRGYTANVGPGTVSVLDLEHRKFITTIPISKTVQRISISNDDKLIFTSDQITPDLVVIDAATNTIRQRVPLPSLGYGSVSSKDGKKLLITLPATGALAVVDLAAMTVERSFDVGPRPQEVILSPDGKLAYVSCFGGHQVAVIDTTTWKIKTMIDVGKKADGMAWAGQGL